MTDAKRWTVEVSAETDAAVRQFLGTDLISPTRLSSFIEDAVRWRLLDQTLTDARQGFDDMPPDAVESLIDEAIMKSRPRQAL